MSTRGIVVQPGQGAAATYGPGWSNVVKLQCDETGGSTMVFEANVPAGTKSTLHLHHDSDEVAYVLSGEVTFLIGDDVMVGGPGTCALMPRGIRHAWKSTGQGTTTEEIRRCRQDLMMAVGDGGASADGRASDLFTMSGFRDLLLHAQEHRCSLIEIAAFLQENGLAFLGFDIAPELLQRYRARFSRDQPAIDLAQWHVFETENPHTFVGMYQFWIQKG